MNRKSIFGIFLILIVLQLTFGAVNATEVIGNDSSADTILSADENISADVLPNAESDESPQTAVTAAGENNIATANLNVSILPIPIDESENEIVWCILIYNHGPDIAHNTKVTVDGTDNLIFENPFNTLTILFTQSGLHTSYYESKGIFDYHHLTWLIGDLQPDSYTELFVKSVKQSLGLCHVEVLATSDTVDLDLSGNYDIAYVGSPITNSNQNAPVNKTLPDTDNPMDTVLPATGNPLITALFGLMVISFVGIKRKL